MNLSTEAVILSHQQLEQWEWNYGQTQTIFVFVLSINKIIIKKMFGGWLSMF